MVRQNHWQHHIPLQQPQMVLWSWRSLDTRGNSLSLINLQTRISLGYGRKRASGGDLRGYNEDVQSLHKQQMRSELNAGSLGRWGSSSTSWALLNLKCFMWKKTFRTHSLSQRFVTTFHYFSIWSNIFKGFGHKPILSCPDFCNVLRCFSTVDGQNLHRVNAED